MTVSVLAALEGVARLLPESLNGRREAVAVVQGRDDLMIASEDVPGWDLSWPEGVVGGTQAYTTNRWRMRGPEYPEEKAADVDRLIIVGDSALFGFGLDWEHTMTAHLERVWEQRRPERDAQVAACACPGHSTFQSLYKLRRHCLAFEPDWVIIGNINSDGAKDTGTDRERFHTAGWSRTGEIISMSALYRTMRNAWLRLRVGDQPPASPEPIAVMTKAKGDVYRVPPDEYEANLREMARLSMEAGARVAFILLAHDGPRRLEETNAYELAMAKVAAEIGAPVVDGPNLFEPYRGQEGLFLTPIHPGKLGAELLGIEIERVLTEAGAR